MKRDLRSNVIFSQDTQVIRQLRISACTESTKLFEINPYLYFIYSSFKLLMLFPTLLNRIPNNGTVLILIRFVLMCIII